MPRGRGSWIAVVVALTALARGDGAAGAADLDARVEELAGQLASDDAGARRKAADALKKIGIDAIPPLLRSAGRDVGSAEWEAALAGLAAIDPDQALATVETCRSEWQGLGWLSPAGRREGRRVVDELTDRILSLRKAEWSKPARLEPALLEDGFRVPPAAASRIDGALPGHLAWNDVPAREKGGKLEIDVANDGRFGVKVDAARAQVVSVGPKERLRQLLVFARGGRWFASSPHVLRGSAGGTQVEILDVQADGDFAGPEDLIRFGEGAFRPVGESPLTWAGWGLARFRLRRDAEGLTISTLPEPEPAWLDEPSRRGVEALARWRDAAGLGPQRVDRERWRACGLHHEYWLHHGFTAHDEDRSHPEATADGERAGKSSSCWGTGDGPRFVDWIGATVLHRSSLVGRTGDGVGFFVGGAGSLLWGGEIDGSVRGAPLLVPGPGQVGVPALCGTEEPKPSRDPSFYGHTRGFPVSVTWSGLAVRPVERARIELFEEGAAKPLAGTTFSDESPYHDDFRGGGWAGDSVIFVADGALRTNARYTARFTAPGSGAEPVEIVWQFRTK